MKKYQYQDAPKEQKVAMIDEIVQHYNVKDRSQLIQALAHCQAVLDCSQAEFAELSSIVDVSSRSVRAYKKEYDGLYQEAFQKYQPEPELSEVESDLEEDALESVYQNLLTRLQDRNTKTRDLAQILEYFGISGNELRAYASNRGKSMRGFYKDSEKVLIPDEDTQKLVQSMIAESVYLYLGTHKSQGNTGNYLQMDLDNPLVRLELLAMGSLMMGLWNGQVSGQFVELASTLRLLKMADGQDIMEKSYLDFQKMDGKIPKTKPITPDMEKDLIDVFGKDEGKEIYKKLAYMKDTVDKKTEVKLPTYEDVKADYDKYLRVFTNKDEIPFDVVLAKIDAHYEKDEINEKYQNYLMEDDK